MNTNKSYFASSDALQYNPNKNVFGTIYILSVNYPKIFQLLMPISKYTRSLMKTFHIAIYNN